MRSFCPTAACLIDDSLPPLDPRVVVRYEQVCSMLQMALVPQPHMRLPAPAPLRAPSRLVSPRQAHKTLASHLMRRPTDARSPTNTHRRTVIHPPAPEADFRLSLCILTSLLMKTVAGEICFRRGAYGSRLPLFQVGRGKPRTRTSCRITLESPRKRLPAHEMFVNLPWRFPRWFFGNSL